MKSLIITPKQHITIIFQKKRQVSQTIDKNEKSQYAHQIFNSEIKCKSSVRAGVTKCFVSSFCAPAYQLYTEVIYYCIPSTSNLFS